MAKHNATIFVTRETIFEGEEIDVSIKVEIEGDFERFGSANPHERGYSLADWWVTQPSRDFPLTKDEEERAEQALYDNL